MRWPDDINQTALPSLPVLSPATRLENTDWGLAYARYYGVDFSEQYPGLRHYLGSVDSGGERIAVQVFTLPGARATAVVLHGYYDHVGLYNNVINYCLQQGYSVVAFDLPGHGLSSGERAAIDNFLRYRQALRDVLAAVRPFLLPQHRIAIAQSTGCAILMSHLLDGGSDDFQKSILLAPLVRPCNWWWGRPAHALLKHMVSSLPRSFVDNSDDQAFLEFLRERDPLQPRTLPLSWIGALKKWQSWFQQLPAADSEVLILQGDADATVDWRYNLPLLRGKFPRLREHLIPGARHHLAKESEQYREQLWAACDQFLGHRQDS